MTPTTCPYRLTQSYRFANGGYAAYLLRCTKPLGHDGDHCAEVTDAVTTNDLNYLHEWTLGAESHP